MADRKRIAENIGTTIVPGKAGETELRNERGRVEIDDGELFSVVIQKASGNVTVTSGIGKASAGNVCLMYLTLRAEDIKRPVEVVKEPEVIK